MMPTFPRSPLSFRTAGFPQYGCKAGFPSGAFPVRRRLKRAPCIRRPKSGLHPPSCASWSKRLSRTVSGRRLDCAPPWRVITPPPQGSSLGSSVPVRHHLIDPIRPTQGHTAISPHGGLYAMPSLCGSASATHEWFRAFAAHSVLTCRPL
jgi:hypothetical protein